MLDLPEIEIGDSMVSEARWKNGQELILSSCGRLKSLSASPSQKRHGRIHSAGYCEPVFSPSLGHTGIDSESLRTLPAVFAPPIGVRLFGLPERRFQNNGGMQSVSNIPRQFEERFFGLLDWCDVCRPGVYDGSARSRVILCVRKLEAAPGRSKYPAGKRGFKGARPSDWFSPGRFVSAVSEGGRPLEGSRALGDLPRGLGGMRTRANLLNRSWFVRAPTRNPSLTSFTCHL
jgi:hypothetical protein